MDLELHIMEYDRTCAEQWMTTQNIAVKQRVHLHFGDQSSVVDLNRVMHEAGARRM